MVSPLLRTVVMVLLATAIGLPSSPGTTGQQPGATRYKHAVVRSQDSAKIIELLSELPEQGFPRELAAQAQGIAVFPLVTKTTVFFQQAMEGYGVVSTRQADGWSLPAFL